MTSRWTFGGIVTGVIGLTLLAAPLRVAADECRQACGAVATTAVSGGKAALKSCKLQCRNDADPRACRRSCTNSLKQARSAARVSLVQCKQTCQPANSCEEQCLAPARQCLAPIVDQAKTCMHDCQATADEAASACVDAPDPFGCLEEAAHQLHMCMEGCATSAHDSAEACKSGLEACKQGCAPANPCEGQCAPALRECLEPVVEQAHRCGDQCAKTAHDGGAACLSDPDPAACLAQVAQQLAQCALGCRSTAEQQAQECRTTFEGCVHDCLPPDPCRDACYATLQECVAPIANDAQACGNQCTADALAAATACLSAEDPVACLLEVERTLGECAHGCEATARGRAAGCWQDFGHCGESCGAPPGGGDGTCRGGCLESAGRCIGLVVDHARSCVDTCANNAVPQALACLIQPDPAACLSEVGQEFLGCAQGCKTEGEADAQECRAGLDSCVAECPADECQDGCVGSLVSCVEPVAGQAESCATGCVTTAFDASAACLRGPNPLICLGQVKEQADQCAHSCRAAAWENGGACWTTYQGCQAGCGQ